VNESGENQAWCSDLYESKAAGLILYGRALGLGHGESEDVVHEVFTELIRRPEPPLEPARYLVRAFRNRVFNRKTSLFRRIARELESHRWFEHGPENSPQEEKALRCLVRLPAEQREVIVLKIWHAYTFEEIGELLKISPNTAAGRYRYGLDKLRLCLKEQGDEIDESFGTETPFVDSTASFGRIAGPPLS
jgi:RNA polymerase sigma-70 factor (ECF subfamily)